MNECSPSILLDHLPICACLIHLSGHRSIQFFMKLICKTAAECSMSFDNSVKYRLRMLFWTLSIVTVYQNPMFWKSLLLHIKTLLRMDVNYYSLINIVYKCCCVTSKHMIMSFHLIQTSDIFIIIQ